jgi:hypothetical protein
MAEENYIGLLGTELEDREGLEMAFWPDGLPNYGPFLRIMPKSVMWEDAPYEVVCDIVLNAEHSPVVVHHLEHFVEKRPVASACCKDGFRFGHLRKLFEMAENGRLFQNCDLRISSSTGLAEIRIRTSPTGRPAARMDVVIANHPRQWIHERSDGVHTSEENGEPVSIVRSAFQIDASRISTAVAAWHALLRKLEK